ncbi:hypothetical protein [Fontimonas sp. SYSU GA230001]|uniref:hypothetical protein n=1 Tax=Fontimonas sp. SYSU GA230001 TaxID=3142450 RepID=UPI0032B53617
MGKSLEQAVRQGLMQKLANGNYVVTESGAALLAGLGVEVAGFAGLSALQITGLVALALGLTVIGANLVDDAVGSGLPRETLVPTPTPTAVPGTPTPTPTAVPGTPTPTPTAVPGTPTPTPTAVPGTPTPTPSAVPSTPTPTPSAVPSTPTPIPTLVPTPTPVTPTPTPPGPTAPPCTTCNPPTTGT